MTQNFYQLSNTEIYPLKPINKEDQGKIYADVPLSFFSSVEDLKNYVLELKNLGVNVLLILPHFLPSLSPYVVKNYEQPCSLFGTWERFAEFMNFVAEQDMDRMIDIPFNHADWQADNLKREWFKAHEENGIEAGADDVDADNNRIRVNWGAFILDNAKEELQTYWLEKVIFPHVEKYNVNSIRIDAAWALDSEGLKRIISETKAKFPQVWFLAENLGMAPLIKLAKSGIEAGADRFFNNIYWYTGGLYIPTDMYILYKRSKGVPTCTIFSSHDVLMPAMKAYAKLRANDVRGMNDKAIVRLFVEYEKKKSLKQLSNEEVTGIVRLLKDEITISALMTSDFMFAAGSEKCLFERIDVLKSNAESFSRGISTDFPDYLKSIIEIKNAEKVFSQEGVIIPIGKWAPDELGLKGFVKSCKDGSQCLVCVNNSDEFSETVKLPKRIKSATNFKIYNQMGYQCIADCPEHIDLKPHQAFILTCRRSRE
ncbi:MAG: hypothetical protein Kow0029_07340 [Candidatus Rifleibacteriota bacterium]